MSRPSETAEEPAALHAPRARCILCGQGEFEISQAISIGAIRKGWETMGVRFSEAAWQPRDDTELVYVWRCVACGFEFSDPELAGNEHFYEELQRQKSNYYPENSQEFARCIRFASEHGVQKILDVGCGAGAFLDLAKRVGLETFGVELNPAGAEAARKKGHYVFDSLLADLVARENSPRFDLVSAWQVVEHVRDPVQFLKECAALVRPGGYLAIAVPNEKGIHRLCPLNPHLWPPHHVTRWRRKDLEAVGGRLGLKVEQTGRDVLFGSAGEHFWKLHNDLAKALNGRLHPGGSWLPTVLSFLYRKLGARYFLPHCGESIFAFYQKTEG